MVTTEKVTDKNYSKVVELFEQHARDLKEFTNPDEAVEKIFEIYNKGTQAIQQMFVNLLEQNTSENPVLDHDIQACYPYVGIFVGHENLTHDSSIAFGAALAPGAYGTTITRPDIFADYYSEQIRLLMENHKIPVYVGVSKWPIPMPFVIDHTPSNLDPDRLSQISLEFTMPDLSRIDDEIANCTITLDPEKVRPLSLFSGERVDFSLHRLHHYTATAPEHFQSFILLTNYHRYIKGFIEFGINHLKYSDEYVALVTPSGIITKEAAINGAIPEDLANMPQMPAYHLKRPDGQGITFINIGVGPTNAKNITDHLAVLRPHCWLMLGHCGGLRAAQKLGDYVLAHGYVREDHVLDEDLPIWIPVPPIAEVQVALQQAAANVSHNHVANLKSEMRTGTVVSTDNRNWELRSHEIYKRFKQSRAIAIDMESATLAANGFRFRVPYGTLLCVSDKPIHGEVKLRGMANAFYQERVKQHLQVGLEAMRIIRERGVDQLHSRKLRGFDEPPFR